jgi:hypothetical protein
MNQTLTDWCGSQTAFGVTISGEFSSGYNGCGLFLLGIANTATATGTCAPFIEWQNWNQTFKDGVRDFTQASMDALQNWFFWTWKVVFFRRRGLIDVKVDSVRALAGWQFLYFRYCGISPVVLQTWTGEWLDTEGPSHEHRKMPGVRR